MEEQTVLGLCLDHVAQLVRCQSSHHLEDLRPKIHGVVAAQRSLAVNHKKQTHGLHLLVV